MDAIPDHEVFQTGRLSEERRWPDFAHRASTESGIESFSSLRLFAEEDILGALNLYSTHTDAFADHTVAASPLADGHDSLYDQKAVPVVESACEHVP